MNITLSKKVGLTAAALIVGLGSGFARADTPPSPKRFGDVVYLTGGVTHDEAQFMKAAASQYNLRVTFVANTGQYLANVPVSVKNERGQVVFDGVSEGPMLWIGVPPGKYVVTAQQSGQPQTQRIDVGTQMHSPVFFRWSVTTDSDL
jgi:hypothetical protein